MKHLFFEYFILFMRNIYFTNVLFSNVYAIYVFGFYYVFYMQDDQNFRNTLITYSPDYSLSQTCVKKFDFINDTFNRDL